MKPFPSFFTQSSSWITISQIVVCTSISFERIRRGDKKGSFTLEKKRDFFSFAGKGRQPFWMKIYSLKINFYYFSCLLTAIYVQKYFECHCLYHDKPWMFCLCVSLKYMFLFEDMDGMTKSLTTNLVTNCSRKSISTKKRSWLLLIYFWKCFWWETDSNKVSYK